MTTFSQKPQGAAAPNVSEVFKSLTGPETEVLQRHAILGTEEGKAYASVASQLYLKGLLAEDVPAKGYRSEPIELTTMGQQIVDALKPLTPFEKRIRAGRILEAQVRKMKDEARRLERLVSKDIQASAYTLGFDLGLEAKSDARIVDLEYAAYAEVERSFLRLIEAHARDRGRSLPEGWGDVDQMAADITNRTMLHMLTDGRPLLHKRLREAIAHGLQERDARAG